MRLLYVTLQRITESYQIIEDDVHSRWKNLYLGMSELGSLESLVVKYARAIGEPYPLLPKKVLFILSTAHGVVNKLDNDETYEIKNRREFYSYVKRLGLSSQTTIELIKKSDVKICPEEFQLGVTADFTEGAAMNEETAVSAIEFGIKIAESWIDKGYQLLLLGNISKGATFVATTFLAGLYQIPATAIYDIKRNHHCMGIYQNIDLIQQALDVNQVTMHNGIDALCKVGGKDIGILAGIILGAASRHAAVIVDGISGIAATALAKSLSSNSIQSVFASAPLDIKQEDSILGELCLHTPIVLNTRLEIGESALMQAKILEIGLQIYQECATKEEMGRKG